MISDVTIKEFQKVIQEEYNFILDDQAGREILTNLVGYFDLLAKINHREQSKDQG